VRSRGTGPPAAPRRAALPRPPATPGAAGLPRRRGRPPPAPSPRAAGGKKGQDITGLSDMGGVKFFTVSLDEPEGDKDLMYQALDGSNAEPNPEEGELKGGAKELGKIFLSYNTDKLSLLCHVPNVIKEKLAARAWVDAVLTVFPAAQILEEKEYAEGECIYAEVAADKSKDQFPIKMRDEASGVSYAHLVKNGLVADDDDDDFDINECEGMDEMEW